MGAIRPKARRMRKDSIGNTIELKVGTRVFCMDDDEARYLARILLAASRPRPLAPALTR